MGFLILPIELVPTEAVGRASGMILCIGYIGGLVGPWVTGHIMDITGSLDRALVVFAILAVIATYLAIKLPESGSKVKLENRLKLQ